MTPARLGAWVACAALAACGDAGTPPPAPSTTAAPSGSDSASAGTSATVGAVASDPSAAPTTSASTDASACPRPADGATLGAQGFREAGWPVEGGDVSPDGTRLVLTNHFGELLWIDVARWTVLGRVAPVSEERHLTPRFLDGERVVTCGIDEKVQVRRVDGQVVAWTPPPDSPKCRDVIVDRRAGRVASLHHPDLTGRATRVVLFDQEGGVLAKATAPARQSAALSGDWFTAEDGERRVVVPLRPEATGQRAPFLGVESGARMLAPGPAGQRRLVEGAEGASPRNVALTRAGGVPRTATFTPDGARLFVFHEAATSSGVSGLALIDAGTSAELRFEPLHWASDYRFDDRGCHAVVFDGVHVHFFDPETGARRATAAVARAR